MISISCAGAEAVAGKFLRAAAVVPRTMPTPLEKCGLLVVRRAKMKAAVDTGHMRSVIAMHPAGRVGAFMAEMDVVSHADYSVYVEFGTSKMAAQPFMGPALDESTPEMERILGYHVVTSMAAVLA